MTAPFVLTYAGVPVPKSRARTLSLPLGSPGAERSTGSETVRRSFTFHIQPTIDR